MDTQLVETTEDGQLTIASMPESLQQRILEASSKLKGASSVVVNKIRNDAKNFILPNGTETDTFSGIIVAAKHANIHYGKEYEEGVSNPPDCFAICDGVEDAANNELIPHSTVISKYATSCKDCTKLQWGSAAKGKGKDCSEYVLLAINIPTLGDDLYLLECKKANAKTADGYLATVTQKFTNPIFVTTSFNMGQKGKWNQSFTAVSAAPGALVMSLAERMDEGVAMLEERVKGAYKDSTESVSQEATPTGSGRKARER